MLSVGISVGANKGVFQKLREHHVKILLIPIGVILGSIFGGVVCSLFLGESLRDSLMIVSGLGWYSLSGVLVTELAGAKIGTIAFLCNLLREIFSFMIDRYSCMSGIDAWNTYGCSFRYCIPPDNA